MWKLNPPSKNLKDWYESKMCPSLVSRIKTQLDKRISKILIPTLPTGGDDISIVRRLLLDSPKELYILCNKLMSKIIPGYHEDEFLDYLIAKDKKYENRSPYEKLLYRKYYNTLNQIRKTFDYEGQLAKNKSRTYHITLEQGHKYLHIL